MNEPSTSHEFKRYIWEDFSVRRARNRVKAEQDYQEWLNAPEAEGEPHLTYIIGPGEVEHQLRNQASHGKGETTTRTKDLKPKAKPKKKEPYMAPKEREREQGPWPDEFPSDYEILHVRSTYV